MLDYIKLEGFKSWNNARVPLSPFTVLVGPNGSGKTSVLQGIDCLLSGIHRKPGEVFVGPLAPEKILSRWRMNAQASVTSGDSIQFSLSTESYSARTGIRLDKGSVSTQPRNGRSATNLEWKWFFVPSDREPGGWTELPKDFPIRFTTVVFAKLSADCLKRPSFSEQTNPQMSPKGYGLPTMLSVWASSRPEMRQQIVARVGRVIPGLSRLSCERVSGVDGMIQARSGEWTHGQRPFFDALKIDLNGVTGLDADSVSEGTLMALGISALLTIHGDENIVLLIDDIEKGLHPKAQRDLAVMIREIVATTPGLQVICTSHSPYMLDECDPEGIVCVWSGENGSECAKLTEHPDFDRWKDEMRPGELWSMFGEEWVMKHKSPAEEASAS
jgi:hypothetical protein